VGGFFVFREQIVFLFNRFKCAFLARRKEENGEKEKYEGESVFHWK
jgi:hypothetical protein